MENNLPSRPLMVEMPIKVNSYDIDVMGIVSNIVYVRWFEDLRFHFLDTWYPFQEMLKEQFSPILSRTEINYKKPLTIYDQPVGQVWLSGIERARWEVSLEIKTEKKLHCTGVQNGYFFNVERKRPVPVPARFHELMEAFRENHDGAEDGSR